MLRSNSPFSFSAAGARPAGSLTPHPPDAPHGLNSPGPGLRAGRAGAAAAGDRSHRQYHHPQPSPYLAMRYRQEVRHSAPEDGQPTRFDYGEIDHCCQNFALVDGWLDAGVCSAWEPWGRAVAAGPLASRTWWRWWIEAAARGWGGLSGILWDERIRRTLARPGKGT